MMGEDVFTWMNGKIWAYRAVFTQTDANGGTIKVNISFPDRGNEFYVQNLLIGRDTYAADRNIVAQILDTNGDPVAKLINQTVSAKYLHYPWDETTVADGVLGRLQFPIVSHPDYLSVSAVGLAQNETLTLLLRLRLLHGSAVPRIDYSGSGGVVTVVENYNRVH